MKANKYRSLLTKGTVFLLLFTLLCSSASASSLPAVNGFTLDLEPSPDQLSIRVSPQILGQQSDYYYTPDATVQKELRALLGELKVVDYTIDANFWLEHPEAGYTIVDAAAQTEWMMLFNDIVLYTCYDHPKDSSYAYMHRGYAKCEMLTQYLAPLMAEKLLYSPIDVTLLTGLTSATLTFEDGQASTVTDPAVLMQLESWFSQSTYLRAPSCPVGTALLTLTTSAGATFELSLVTDSCPYFCFNGIYYDYTPWDLRQMLEPGTKANNSFLFDCFPEVHFEPIDLRPKIAE
ncbi:MAG: hypothetical protein E7319_03050 [Clostridiales bacterium]|nr:hypothetical protein [Clostridiales bacterium]